MVKKMIEIAADGDRVAARLVLSGIWAAPKARAVPIELPEISKPDDWDDDEPLDDEDYDPLAAES
jgi:hypothetical protein